MGVGGFGYLLIRPPKQNLVATPLQPGVCSRVYSLRVYRCLQAFSAVELRSVPFVPSAYLTVDIAIGDLNEQIGRWSTWLKAVYRKSYTSGWRVYSSPTRWTGYGVNGVTQMSFSLKYFQIISMKRSKNAFN